MSLSRSSRLLCTAASAAAAASLLLSAPLIQTASAATAGATPVFNATTYGAICDGTLRPVQTGGTVDGNAIQAAVRAAEHSPTGGTVVLPPGTCNIGTALLIAFGPGITLEGTVGPLGQELTTLTDTINPQGNGGAISVTSDHNTIQDLTVDESQYGQAVYVQANYTTIQRTDILGGPAFFALFMHALKDGSPAVGNRLLDSTVVARVNHLVLGGNMACDDGLSWSGQDQSLIQNLNFVGTRLAIYEDSNTTVDGFVYHPGPQTCGLDGYYITQPASNITMEHLTMYGSAGNIGNGSLTNGVVSGVSISDETVLPPAAGPGFNLNGTSHGMIIRNVDGVSITGSNLASGLVPTSSIALEPTASANNVTVSSTTVPRVTFWGMAAKGATTRGTVSNVTLTNDTFPALGAEWGKSNVTVSDGNTTPATFTVSGGSWMNQQPGLPAGSGFYKGNGPVTYTVNGLAGY